MFSNLEIKPVRYGSEGYEGEKGLAELFVASADTPAAFDAGEKIFDHVAMSIRDLGIVILDPIRLPRWDTGSRAEAEEFFAKGLRYEAAVREDEAGGEFIHQRFHRFEVVPIAGHEIQPAGPVQSIDDHSQFRIRASLGFTNVLSLGAVDGVRGILTDFDVCAVHTADRAAGIGREQREHLRPKSTSASATKPSVD